MFYDDFICGLHYVQRWRKCNAGKCEELTLCLRVCFEEVFWAQPSSTVLTHNLSWVTLPICKISEFDDVTVSRLYDRLSLELESRKSDFGATIEKFAVYPQRVYLVVVDDAWEELYSTF